jgi:hypothetical protein
VEKKLFQCHFAHYKSHMDWPSVNLGMRGGRSATNHLSWLSRCWENNINDKSEVRIIRLYTYTTLKTEEFPLRYQRFKIICSILCCIICIVCSCLLQGRSINNLGRMKWEEGVLNF